MRTDIAAASESDPSLSRKFMMEPFLIRIMRWMSSESPLFITDLTATL